MAELLEATKQMMKYFKRLLKHTPKHTNSKECYQNKTNTSHSDKCRHKPDYHKEEVNEITSDTGTPKHISTKSTDTPQNTVIDSLDSTADSSLDSV